MRDLIHGEAELDDEEDDESYDEETGDSRPRPKRSHIEDSSEEEEDDDDEEEARKVSKHGASLLLAVSNVTAGSRRLHRRGRGGRGGSQLLGDAGQATPEAEARTQGPIRRGAAG
jgi:hypothetical protein